ncbi:MAG: TraR/DksA family transcriptional regulator [Gammaproteobacteria bacterium]|nr:TraR/DksA family transcriptional regulator [Gammaproteobacteria bacterium]
MDDVDKAQQEVEHQISTSITNRKLEDEVKAARPPVTKCIECEEVIPIERQLIMPGCQRCVTCKERSELLNKRINHA